MGNVSVYCLKCLTNMHVGDGEANYNIIDNEVQKDIVLNVPTIHSSGVKGALRSFVHNHNQGNAISEDEIFGAKGEETRQGAYKFFSANLLARPIRVSDGSMAYVLATSVDIINTQLTLMQSLGVWTGELLGEELRNKYICSASLQGMISEVEGEKIECAKSLSVLDELIGDKWVLVPHDRLCDYGLPVQARNVLENGKSQNLWYEEVVPHESIFYVIVITDGKEDVLYDFICQQGGVVQFGADASIGYGFCKVTKWEKAGE